MENNQELAVGDKVPNFTLPSDQDKNISISILKMIHLVAL
jgi:peroxiredoxin